MHESDLSSLSLSRHFQFRVWSPSRISKHIHNVFTGRMKNWNHFHTLQLLLSEEKSKLKAIKSCNWSWSLINIELHLICESESIKLFNFLLISIRKCINTSDRRLASWESFLTNNFSSSVLRQACQASSYSAYEVHIDEQRQVSKFQLWLSSKNDCLLLFRELLEYNKHFSK